MSRKPISHGNSITKCRTSGLLHLLSVLITVICRNNFDYYFLKCFLPFSEVESEVTEMKTENGLQDVHLSRGERISQI